MAGAKQCAATMIADQFSVNFTRHVNSQTCEFELQIDDGYLCVSFKSLVTKRSPTSWQKTRLHSVWQTWKN